MTRRPPTILSPMDALWTPWRFQYVSTADLSERQGVPSLLADWPGDTGCVFCNLLAASAYAVQNGMAPDEADRAANIVYRGEQCFICLNAFPYNSGHAMILPYTHIDELARLDPSAAQEMMVLAQRLEQSLEKNLSPERNQSRHEPGEGRRSRSHRSSAPAYAAALAGRYQLYDRDRRNAGVAGEPRDYMGAAAHGISSYIAGMKVTQ